MPDLEDVIVSAASSPQMVTTPSATVSAQPLSSLIAADQYLATKASARNRNRGLRFTKFIGPQQCSSEAASDI